MTSMKLNRRKAAAATLLAAAAPAQSPTPTITHGPFLGHITSTDVHIWARTASAGSFRILYGTSPTELTQTSQPATTTPDHDNSAWLRITGLTPGTRYHYRIEGTTAPEHAGVFLTVPSPDSFRDPDSNPKGLFNFSFQFGSCADQKIGGALGATLPAYKTMRQQHGKKVLFSIMNGDWVYEEKRDYTVEQWLNQCGLDASQTPAIAKIAPSITGVWENFKLYLERGKAMATWHREVPGYFTPDDHEILNDVTGTGTTGVKTQEAVFRDIALRGWYDYIAGSNPLATRQPIHLGQATLSGNILTDPNSDFTKINLAEASNLHIHWGGQRAGVPPGRNAPPGNPNAGVYEIDQVLDAHRIRVKPGFPQSGPVSYSIGRQNYSSFRVGNVEVYLLDTRGTRDLGDFDNPRRQGPLMLGTKQHQWLKSSMAASTADFFFIASSVNLMIPHVGAPTSNDPIKGKDDAWTAFLAEREELIAFWDKLGKPVCVMTGDLHNSWSIKVTDRVWEFAAGPHNSQNHPALSEGSRPPNGPFDSRGRQCEIRWSSYIRNDVPARLRYWPIYAVAQINNVFPNPRPDGSIRWVAYPRPHVLIQYFDGVTGDLLYAEPVHHNA
jgi:alkaline phosphatase D